jgi:hypothetical protein
MRKTARAAASLAVFLVTFHAIGQAAWAQGGSYGGGVIAPGTRPFTLNGTSGGPRQARIYGAQCRGSIATTPDHVFSLTQPMRVRFEVIRAAGDTTLVIVGPAGVLCDDDSGGNTNPRIIQDLPPGTYQVFVGSYANNQLHPYTLRVRHDVQRGNAGIGAPIRGTFAPGLPVDGSGRPYVDYNVQINAPGQYRIDLTSSNASLYDPLLELRQGGAVLARDDDGGGYPNSRVTISLNPGSYVVRASSFRAGQVPAPVGYTLTIAASQAPPPPGPGPGMGIPGARIVVPGVPVTGTFRQWLPLEQGSGRPYMDFALTVAVPGTYQINLVSANSSTYDPYLRLMMVNGAEIAHDDDGGGYPNSRIVRQLLPGIYRLRVTSYNAGQLAAPTGFTLTVSQ